jgi:CHASE2 domain-containing sensor protein
MKKGRPTKRRQQLLDIGRYVSVGLGITLLLVAAKLLIERQPIGHRSEILTYEFLQGQLSPFSADERLPVLVVDISKIVADKDGRTPRGPLMRLIEAIANQGAKAIAIDVDFAPTITGWSSPEDDPEPDPKIFEFCLKLKRDKGVPVFLGVYYTRAEEADAWLGSLKYKELAAAGVAPEDDVSKMPRWIQTIGVADRLPTLSASLANAYQESLPGPPKWLAWSIETTDDHQHGVERQVGNELRIAETLVNYSKLEQLQHEYIGTITPDSVKEEGEKFRGRMVILGDANRFIDPFVVPGRSSAIGGVYLEASHAYTLAIEPLYEFKHSIRLVLDLVISIAIILGVAGIRYRHLKEGEKFHWHKWQSRFIYATVALVIFAGILLVRWWGIMWLDFFLVVFALLLHPSVEGWVDRFKKGGKGDGRKSPARREKLV